MKKKAITSITVVILSLVITAGLPVSAVHVVKLYKISYTIFNEVTLNTKGLNK